VTTNFLHFMEENIPDPNIEVPVIEEEVEGFRHLNNPADGIKPIVKKYLGIPNRVEQVGNKFYFTDGEAKVEAWCLPTRLSAYA
jgi:alpha-glucosidase